MKTTYLLPCQCGERFQVDASESGLVMTCRCGARLEVPTMRGLAKLEKVVVEDAAPGSTWGGSHRGMVIGALVLLLGLGASIWWTAKPIPKPADVLEDKELIPLGILPQEKRILATPAGSLFIWRLVEGQGLDAAPGKLVEKYQRARSIVTWWRFASYSIGAVGLAILGVSFFVHRRLRSRKPDSRAVPAPTP
jgi:hypothetical protein